MEGDERSRGAGDTDVCAVCGEEIDAGYGQHFSAADYVVCHQCARRYGGVFDSENGRWGVAPTLPPPHRKEPY